MDFEEEICKNLIKKKKLSELVDEIKHVKYIYHKNITIALVEVGKCTLKGVSICSSKDQYDKTFGQRIAFANAVGKR